MALLRPTAETKSAGIPDADLYVSPAGASFPYGVSSSTTLVGGNTLTPDFKAIAAAGSTNGAASTCHRFVTYSGFSSNTDSWVTPSLWLQMTHGGYGAMSSTDSLGYLAVCVSTDRGQTWTTVFEYKWDVDAGDNGRGGRYLTSREVLSNGAQWVTGLANNKMVTQALKIPLTGLTDTTQVQVRFEVKAAQIFYANTQFGDSNYLSLGFDVSDIYLFDSSASAATPGSSVTPTVQTNTIKSGTGLVGDIDPTITYATVMGGGTYGDFAPVSIPTPDAAWYTLPGSQWVSPALVSRINATTVAPLISGQSQPIAGSKWVGVAADGSPSVSKCRFLATFNLPTAVSASLVLQYMFTGDASSVYLNGTLVDSYTGSHFNGPIINKTISTGFQAGLNTLEFELNGSNGALLLADYLANITYSGGSLKICSGSGVVGSLDTSTSCTILAGSNTSSYKGYVAGSYVMRYHFTVPTGATSPSLNVSVLGDNAVTSVLVNGHSIGGQTDNGSASNTQYWTKDKVGTYTTNNYIVVGDNTLDFIVKNYEGAVGLDFLGQVAYTAPNMTTTTPATTVTSYDTPIVVVGGEQPYSYTIVADAQTTLPITACSIVSPSLLRVNGSGVTPGKYGVHVRVTDAAGAVDEQVITVNIYDSSRFVILNETSALTVSQLPYTGTLSLQQAGGSGTVTWSAISSGTTLPSVSVTGSVLTYTVSQYGDYQIYVSAVDGLGKTATKILLLSITSPTTYKLVDGQLELVYSDNQEATPGSHGFSFTLNDSASSVKARSYNYQIGEAPSTVYPKMYTANYYWTEGADYTLKIPINGVMSGITIGDVPTASLPNGLTYSVDGANQVIQISGSATSPVNSVAYVEVPLKMGSTVVGSVERAYPVVAIEGSTLSSLGENSIQTLPHYVGQMFSLNLQKPYFNSPDFSRNSTWTAQVKAGTTLPTGISLDKLTGLLYGPVVSTEAPTSSVVEFVDQKGNTVGSYSITYNFVSNDITLTDNLPIGYTGVAYSGTLLSDSVSSLTDASVYYGALPDGLSLSVSANHAVLSGTPTEAGVFDIWFTVTNAEGKKGYLRKRMELVFNVPLTVITTSLPAFQTSQAYSTSLQAVGGSGTYTWTLTAGSLPAGFLLATNGTISGTTTVSSYSQALTFTVTDSKDNTAIKILTLAVGNALTITTGSPLPNPVQGLPYSVQLQGTGGSGTGYTWTLASGSPALPSGISLSSAGLISGTTQDASYNQSISIKLTDSASATTTKSLTLSTLTSNPVMHIYSTGVGRISRGCAYQGLLQVSGGQAPYSWTCGTLPSGLALTPNSSDNGVTCYISGSTTLAFTGTSVPVTVVDAGGKQVTDYVLLSSQPSVTVDTYSLPQAKVNTAYSQTLQGHSCNTPYTWSLDASSPALPSGFMLNSSGFLSGTTSDAYNQNIVVRLTDAIGDSTTQSINLNVVSSNLTITTTSIPAIPAGQAWSDQLQATGGTAPYTWSVSDPTNYSQPTAASGFTIAVTGSATSTGASGTYTITMNDTQHTYSGVGTFNWSTEFLIPTGSTTDYHVAPVIPFAIRDLTMGIDIAQGSFTFPLTLSGATHFPATVSTTGTMLPSGLVSTGTVLPSNVVLASTGSMSTTGTTDAFSKNLLFKVTDALGAVATKTLNVTVQSAQSTLGSLVSGVDRALGTSKGYLGAISLHPGDVSALNPHPLDSFVVYGTMPGVSASQLTVDTVVNGGTGAYQNLKGYVSSVDATSGLVKIQFHFDNTSQGTTGTTLTQLTQSPATAGSNSVSVRLANSATGAAATGNFTFVTVDTGVLKLYQVGMNTLPVTTGTVTAE